MNTNNNKKIKLKFVCPHCGEEDCLEEIQRINELHVPIVEATVSSSGDVELEAGEADLCNAEVIDSYYRCSACSEHFLDPDPYFVPVK